MEEELQRISFFHENLRDLKQERDHWKGLCQKMALSLIVVSVIAVTGVSALFFKEREYFATTPNGQITPLVPLNKPIISPSGAQRFAVNAISDALSLNFRQWRGQLAAVEPSFTTGGYKEFLTQLEKTKWIKMIESEFMTTTVTERMRPVLVQHGVNSNGVYGYVIEVPLVLLLENQTERKTQKLDAKIIVVRVPTAERPEGMAIDKIFIS